MRILHHANVITQNTQTPRATALAIEHGKIIAVGSDDEIRNAYGAHAEREDMGGRTILPGLTDAHIHLETYALSLTLVDCETPTRAECLRRVAERARSTPPGAWIRGHGWNQNLWPEGFGSVEQLDEITRDHPVYLTAKSLHAGWANSAALRAAGISASTPDPQDGKLVRDAHGNPTGILLEAAMTLVVNAIPAPTADQVAEAIKSAQTTLWSLGITGVHDFDRARCFTALQMLDATGDLRLRVVKSIPLELLPEAARMGLRSGFGAPFLRIGGVKLFADGALGPHTAAMLQPYEDDPSNTGILFLDSEQVYKHGQIAVSSGIPMAIHAIGDRANHEVLTAFRQLRAYEKEIGAPPLRHRIEHVQCLHPQDYAALAELDIIASVQPIHATSDMHMADQYWGARSHGAYAFRTLLEQGTRLVFGSDAPVESPNPWWGIHAAVTRRRSDGSPGVDGWYPAQKLTLDEALAGYTTGPAYAAGCESSRGQLAPGYDADLIVIGQDPYAISRDRLHEIKTDATMVQGDWVWIGGKSQR